MTDLDDDPTPEEVAAFREVGREIAARIKSLETQLTEDSGHVQSIPTLKAVHEAMPDPELASLIDRLVAQGGTASLRELVLTFVESAHVVERQPANRSTWTRLHVTWKKDVQTLLDAGLLHLDPPVERPYHPTVQEQKHANYLARKATKAVPAAAR
jgi:hypothetical protein